MPFVTCQHGSTMRISSGCLASEPHGGGGADDKLCEQGIRAPPDFHPWNECWEVYQTAMIMTDAAIPSRLYAYTKKQKRPNALHGKLVGHGSISRITISATRCSLKSCARKASNITRCLRFATLLCLNEFDPDMSPKRIYKLACKGVDANQCWYSNFDQQTNMQTHKLYVFWDVMCAFKCVSAKSLCFFGP